MAPAPHWPDGRPRALLVLGSFRSLLCFRARRRFDHAVIAVLANPEVSEPNGYLASTRDALGVTNAQVFLFLGSVVFARHRATAEVASDSPRFALETLAFGGMLTVPQYCVREMDGLQTALFDHRAVRLSPLGRLG